MISCKPPEARFDSELSNGVCSRAMVELQQLHVQVGKFLSSDVNFQDGGEFLRNMQRLIGQVQTFRAKLRPAIDLDVMPDTSNLPTGRRRDMSVSLRYKYFEVLFRIHSCLVYPWLRPSWTTRQPDNFPHAVEESTAILSRVSRQVLLSTPDVRLDPSCRFW